MTGATDNPMTEGAAGPEQVDDIVSTLDDLARENDEVSFGDIVETLGAKGYGPLLLALAALMVLPVGMIPGVGGAIGLVMAVIGLQTLRGRTGLWLPKTIRDRCIGAQRIRGAADRLRPAARWLRKRLKPRLVILAEGRVSLTVIALLLIALGLSMTVLGAIPVLVPLAGLPVLFFALGTVARDGAAVAAGYLLLIPPLWVGLAWG
ncbi:exopolysaccharide biosynthesis protein [Histidinibacterium aquaticum]|uniref:Exopolysaccharide biosynthesis protein n=1 Tax=Histidinibacterium aquaticum TaxID=2613962 RepID=A0A5J5GN64_9RHOB|nr:exopolysaccharide biosynthesis protein [Histidinibacterium aquaticum]KAA9009719.1 exopolysaccharide biosynthesis protein [Histidinibacterium aquaticum]